MAWNEEMIPLVRGLIGDITDTNFTYTDSQVHEYIIYSAYLNQNEITFDNTYTIDISQQTIIPDPVGLSDKAFVNLTCLKAAILILRGEVKTAASKAVKVVDGPSSLDYTAVFKAKKELYDDMNKDFDEAKLAAALGDLSVGEAVLTPYTVNYL